MVHRFNKSMNLNDGFQDLGRLVLPVFIQLRGKGRVTQGEDLDGFEPIDFKKRDGFNRSLRLSKELDLYRQDYCGCEFSMRKG